MWYSDNKYRFHTHIVGPTEADLGVRQPDEIFGAANKKNNGKPTPEGVDLVRFFGLDEETLRKLGL